MRPRGTALVVTLAAVIPLAATCTLAAARPGAMPARAAGRDTTRRIDANRVNLFVTNVGQLGCDLANYFSSGLYYPRGTGSTLLYVAGLWLGGTVDGETRVTVAEYSTEYAPGAMPGGVPGDPASPEFVVYKVARWTGNPADSAQVVRGAAEVAADLHLDPLAHHSWSEYMAGAAPHGAPWRYYRLPDSATPAAGDSVDVPGPDVRGDQMLWCVFNDGDPANHVPGPGGTAPLGVEVRQTLFAYDRPGTLGNTVFLRWDLYNRGANTIPDLRTALWADPDIGLYAGDDLTGCDTTRSLGYGYNVLWGTDPGYGSAIPALGFDLLGGDMEAFTRYIGGTDPSSPVMSWNYMLGLQPEGGPFLDPAGTQTRYMHAGDPLLGTGWVDFNPADRRLMAAAGPHAFAPGESLAFWVAIVVGQGGTPAASIRALRCASDDAQDVFDAGFAEPFAAPRECGVAVTSCPRGADWWAAKCAADAQFTAPQWNAIARWADSASTVFAFAEPNESDGYCAVLGATATARDSARREYLALLSNVAAGQLGLVPADGLPAGLALETGVLAPPLLGTTVAGLLHAAPAERGLCGVRYEDAVPDDHAELIGVYGGLPYFGGGAGTAARGTGSALDPSVAPDSFPSVLLRFDHSAGQNAYRYLRLETADGSPPTGGREYRYGGHRLVPLTAWDLHTGLQLELAFCERAVTSATGTLLASAEQPATFDSTWAPDQSWNGGYEDLWVLARPYSATPRAAFAVDAVPLAGRWPALYELHVRRAHAQGPDDGDGLRFVAGYLPTTSAEGLVAALEVAAPADTEAQELRGEVAAALRPVNLGLVIGPVCTRPAPFAATLIEATVEYPLVTLRWRLGEPATSARLEWRTTHGVWMDGGPATLLPGGEAATTFMHDYDYPPVRHAYRLVAAAAIGIMRSDSVWVDAPRDPPALALTRVWPSPSRNTQSVSFTLPASGPAKLEVFDLNGRRAYERDLGTLSAGLRQLELAPGRRFRPGVYFVVLRFGAERRTARFVVL